MERGGSLLIPFILQFIVLSLANENLVPIFISEIGKSAAGICSKILSFLVGIISKKGSSFHVF